MIENFGELESVRSIALNVIYIGRLWVVRMSLETQHQPCGLFFSRQYFLASKGVVKSRGGKKEATMGYLE